MKKLILSFLLFLLFINPAFAEQKITGNLTVTGNTTINGSISASNLSGRNTGDQDLSGLVPKITTVNGHALNTNITVTKTDVGLSNVDNTSDVNKPISTATQTALNAKQNTITTGTTAQYFKGDLSLATFPTAISFFTNDVNYLKNDGSNIGSGKYLPSITDQTNWGTAYTNNHTHSNKTILDAISATPATDSLVVHLAGTETITGAKTTSNNFTLTNNAGAIMGRDSSNSLRNLLYISNANKIMIGDDAGVTSNTLQGYTSFSNNISINNTTFASQNGIVYKNGVRFLHDFNYGNNGTVTTGGGNTFLGLSSGNFTMGSTATASTDSSLDTAIGYSSGNSLTIGRENTFLGAYSGTGSTSGSQNVCVGTYTGTTLNDSTGVTLLGRYAGYSLYGNYNIAIGANSGRFLSDGSTSLTGTSNSLYIGANTKGSANGITNEIVIGYNATGNGSNTVTLGNTSVTDVYAAQGATATVNAGKFKLSALNTAPASATATGALGEIRIDANYIYVCVATNTWKRSALTSW